MAALIFTAAALLLLIAVVACAAWAAHCTEVECQRELERGHE